MDEALAGHATFIEVELEAGRLHQRHRQRPRHPGRSASEVQEQVGAGSDHVHAARRRQVRLQGLRDLGRPARRRRVGGERAVRPHGGRGRARPEALPDGVRARQAEGQAAGCRQGAEPPRHQGALPSRRGNFRAEGRVQGRARVQDDALEGLSVRRRRDPLVLRQGAGRRHRRAGRGDVPFRGRAEGLSRRDLVGRDARRPTSSPAAPARPARMAARNGRWPGPPTPTASSTPTATPSRRRTAARTSPGFAPRCSAA